MSDDLEFIPTVPGQQVEGRLLRPWTFQMVRARDMALNEVVLAIRIVPMAGDPEFREPIVIMLPERMIDAFAAAISAARAYVAPSVIDEEGNA